MTQPISYNIQARVDEAGKPYLYVLVHDENHGDTEEDHEYSMTFDSDGWELVVSSVIDSRGGGFDG